MRKGEMGVVAPHAGAWIETGNGFIAHRAVLVAPHAGAWIETRYRERIQPCHLWSPPTRGRGLKPRVAIYEGGRLKVAPHAGAWIET